MENVSSRSINRESALAESAPQLFPEANSFRLLDGDEIAINSAVSFWVETFAPIENFQPHKYYQSRLKWRDREGRASVL